jgi:hypothetical protein
MDERQEKMIWRFRPWTKGRKKQFGVFVHGRKAWGKIIPIMFSREKAEGLQYETKFGVANNPQ